MRRTRLLWLLTIATIAPSALACAKSAEPAPSPAVQPTEPTEPPRMLTRGNFPDLSISAPNAAGRPSVRMRIEVLVDTSGRADLKTLKLTGLGAPENRMAIERWLETALFRPAMRNGRRVSGVYKTSLEVRIQVRRL